MATAGDDDAVALHPATLAALAEFRREKEEAEARAAHEAEDDSAKLLITEDYGESQFWYSEETSQFLAEEACWCREQLGRGEVVFLSSPSAYKAYRSLERKRGGSSGGSGGGAHVFEYDARFAVFGEAFVKYDYNHPLEGIPERLLGQCSVVMLDPPFLNRDCLAGFAETVRALQLPTGETRVLLATGAVQIAFARELLGLRPTQRPILHAGGRLSNPFALYTNYAHEETLRGWDVEAERASGLA